MIRYHLVARDGLPNIESIELDLEYYWQAGYVEAPLDIDRHVDLEAVEYAAASLDSNPDSN